jgi:nucleotide-binding universal stress UspA family protein
MTETEVTRKIVVGVDGSPASMQALRYAIAEARYRGTSVEIVHGWHVPYYGDFTGVMPYPGEELASAAERIVQDALASVETEAHDVVVTGRTVESPPAYALTEAGKDAELIVVGRRGHGGFLGLLLGSVAQQVANHATCPVVLVPVE